MNLNRSTSWFSHYVIEQNKIGTQELIRRKKDIQELAKELNALNQKILGRRQDVEAPDGDSAAGSGSGSGSKTGQSLEQLMSGNLPQRKVRQEEMSQEQEMKLKGIQQEQQEQDNLLDQISSSLDQLKETTLDINDVSIEPTERLPCLFNNSNAFFIVYLRN